MLDKSVILFFFSFAKTKNTWFICRQKTSYFIIYFDYFETVFVAVIFCYLKDDFVTGIPELLVFCVKSFSGK